MKSKRRAVAVTFILLGVSTFLLGFHGLSQYLHSGTGDPAITNVVAGLIGLFLGEGFFASGRVPPSLAFAQICAPFVTAYATFELFRSRIERLYRIRRSRSRANHVVLVGLGRSNRLVAGQLALADEPCVIALDPDVERETFEIFNRPRWAVIEQDASKPRALRAVGVQNASLVHIATGFDGLDIEIAETIRSLATERTCPGHLEIKVQIDSPTLARRLQQAELHLTDSDTARVEFVNINGLGAAVIMEYITTELSEIARPSTDVPLAVGMEFFGDEALIEELCRLSRRSHQARKLLDCATVTSHEPSELGVRVPPPAPAAASSATFDNIIIVQFTDSTRTVDEAALHACRSPRNIVFALSPSSGSPVRIPGRPDSGPIILLDPDRLTQTPDILQFGPIELMARLIHLDYIRSLSESAETDALPAAFAWNALPETFKKANRAQAFDFGRKLSLIDCELSDTRSPHVELTQDEIETLAILEHNRWMGERLREGWTHGPLRDDRSKRHPNLVPYDQLSDSEREKDRQAIRRLPALAALIGLVIVRRT